MFRPPLSEASLLGAAWAQQFRFGPVSLGPLLVLGLMFRACLSGVAWAQRPRLIPALRSRRVRRAGIYDYLPDYFRLLQYVETVIPRSVFLLRGNFGKQQKDLCDYLEI